LEAAPWFSHRDDLQHDVPRQYARQRSAAFRRRQVEKLRDHRTKGALIGPFTPNYPRRATFFRASQISLQKTPKPLRIFLASIRFLLTVCHPTLYSSDLE
jgi:hypothetical protein